MVAKPREFCEAMRQLVVRSQQNPATAVGDQAYDMKLRVLDFFVARDSAPADFERLLRERIADSDPAKELSRGVCCQILNSWRSGSCYYTPEGQLVLKALYPADYSNSPEDDGREE